MRVFHIPAGVSRAEEGSRSAASSVLLSLTKAESEISLQNEFPLNHHQQPIDGYNTPFVSFLRTSLGNFGRLH